MDSQRLIRIDGVRALTGLGRSHLYALIKEKKFPRAIKLSERASAWLEADVKDWVEARIRVSALEAPGIAP
jgi:prophage regulatory protein